MSVPSNAVDLTSPNFDPLQALYSNDAVLPCPDILPFDNLAQYESSTKNVKNDAETADASRKERSVEEALAARKKKTRWGVEKTPVLARKEREPSALSTLVKTSRKQRYNVLTKMKGHYRGPLAILSESVYKRWRVKVWTRAARQVRGFCTGFIVAFDKHFNLAMVDVDESYLPPSVEQETTSVIRRRKRMKKKLKEKLAEQPEQITSEDFSVEKPILHESPCTTSDDDNNGTTVGLSVTDNSKININEETSDINDLTERLKHLQDELAHIPEVEDSVSENPSLLIGANQPGHKASVGQSMVSKDIDSGKEPDSVKTQLHDKTGVKRDITGSKYKIPKVRAVVHEKKKLKHLQDELAPIPDVEDSVSVNPSLLIGVDQPEHKASVGQSMVSKEMDSGEEPDSVKRQLDKTGVKKNITGSKFKIPKVQAIVHEKKESDSPQYLHRHVDQLFIRGDNVVMVSFMDQ